MGDVPIIFMNKYPRPLRWLIIAVLIVFVLSVLKDLLIKTAIEFFAPPIVGAKVEMTGFELGLFNHQIHITNFKLYNPPGFPDQEFLVIPEIRVQADIPSLMKGRMYFPLVVLNMDKMVVVKNKDGKMNVDELKIIKDQQEANKGKRMKLPVFKIDLMELNVGKVIMEDYTHAPPAKVEAYDVNIKDQKIRNINGLPKLVTAILIEAMKPTAIRSAGLFAAEALLGVGFLPAVAIGVAIAQDDVNQDMNHSFSDVYQECLKMISDLDGTVKNADQQSGVISAKVYNCDITFYVKDLGWSKSHIRIKARQYFLAKLEIANGLLYQLNERLP